eukprot:10421504-Alexandrium_andersonii.AAC.1
MAQPSSQPQCRDHTPQIPYGPRPKDQELQPDPRGSRQERRQRAGTARRPDGRRRPGRPTERRP